MKHTFFNCYGLITLITLLILPFRGQTQDPEWLKIWEECYNQRPSELKSYGRITSKEEAGIPMVIKGKVFRPNGYVAAGVIVHAYHRDDKGFDFGKDDKEFTTWRLQGWIKTDSTGSFELHTIRPAPDHLGREGAHIHITLITKQYGRQWAPTVFLADDPLVTESQRLRSKQAGKFAWVCEVEKRQETQFIRVNIRIKTEGDF
ncbi:MAG: hypothetical protein AAFO07_11335 [Bacteroidota bacterium]